MTDILDICHSARLKPRNISEATPLSLSLSLFSCNGIETSSFQPANLSTFFQLFPAGPIQYVLPALSSRPTSVRLSALSSRPTSVRSSSSLYHLKTEIDTASERLYFLIRVDGQCPKFYSRLLSRSESCKGISVPIYNHLSGANPYPSYLSYSKSPFS